MKSRGFNFMRCGCTILLLTLANFAIGQSYTIIPNDSIGITGVLEDLQTLSIQQENATSDTIYLGWEKVSAIVPEFWEASVCDNSLCYASLVDSGSMNPVFPGEYGLILIHCTPHVIDGTAIIRYCVWDLADPLHKDTLTYTLNVISTGTLESQLQNNNVWVSDGEIHMEDMDKNIIGLQIIDISGREVFNTIIYERSVMKLPLLPAALYLVRLFGPQSQIIKYIYLSPF